MEWLLAGSKLQRCRMAFLEEVKGAGRILLLGEGHGRFLEELVRVNPAAQITCLDASAGMLREAKQRLAQSHRNFQVELTHADVFSWVPEACAYDLIVTHFFLDCFTEQQINGLVNKLSSCLKPSGKWLLADFCKPAKGLKRFRASAILWLMYRFFRMATQLPASQLASPDESLAANGFRLEKRLAFDWGLLHADLWALGMSSAR